MAADKMKLNLNVASPSKTCNLRMNNNATAVLIIE